MKLAIDLAGDGRKGERMAAAIATAKSANSDELEKLAAFARCLSTAVRMERDRRNLKTKSSGGSARRSATAAEETFGSSAVGAQN